MDPFSVRSITQANFVRGHKRTPSDAEFRDAMRKDAQSAMNKELNKLLTTAPPGWQEQGRKEFDGFENLFGRFLRETGPSVEWEKLKLLPPEAIKKYNELSSPSPQDTKNLLNNLVVIKLNGGLGTSMGCTGPKSAIQVRNELTFLDMNVQQIEHLNKTYGVDVPLVLMNSFNTDEDTQKILRKYSQIKVSIFTFNQSRYPRINRDTLMPVPRSFGEDSIEGWYPPGHGDVYNSLYNSGLLEKFIKDGKKFIFISNIDNMGATVDLNILNFLVNSPQSEAPEFVMEVTDKTRADVKGGTLIEYEGKLRLLEYAQVPSDHVDEFKSVSKFKIFNTNNLWISLDAIKRNVEEETLHMEIIVNPKTLDNGMNVIQLETAVGAAIKSFDRAVGINVPRSRFLPVKTTSDLLIVMSNLYAMRTGSLEMSPKRSFPSVPLVKLGHQFSKVKDFLNRFASIPDLLELDHLTVAGDVNFGKNVSLRGTVIIIANHGEKIDIPMGSILENKIVSGNLRILDH
ncbi:UTP--glucose-1-phosphate uridylyltransferase-like isoform X2 [Biomphalaria glabrata]|uniref:UTP--glucose-1-phosphate uridylyltransferase n=1 Tax=Biomphalaria glabrata TaxID=6526 RepID=A0A9W2ZTY4_BIOGL|nr:UTP--glucose-1-phosphate uridylyltransferase-like isoform X2 [Biomphalaria glabrata]KAI8741322.1 UTP--glucose-1-phosphate uridylyltransferase [Biomphalaria glabrata]